MGLSQSEFQPHTTLVTRLEHTKNTRPNKELMIFYDGTKRRPYTARQLFDLGGSFASRLKRDGFKRGDVIANTLPNSPERLITDIGILMAGCIAMNGQILLADGADLFLSCRQARCAAIVLMPSDSNPAWTLMGRYVGDVTSGLTSDLTCDQTPEMKKAVLVTRDGDSSSPPLLENLENSTQEEIFLNPDIRPDDIATVNCTSGSTGYSKLVPRTHKEIILGYEGGLHLAFETCPWLEGQTMYSDRPLGWSGGFPYGMFCHGDTRVLTDAWRPSSGHLSGEAMWNIIKGENCSIGIILPLDVSAIMNHLETTEDQDAKDFKMRVVLTGGQPMFKNQIESFFAIADSVFNGYGATETLLIATSWITKETINDIEDYCCGQTRKDLTVRLVNTSGQDCRVGEDGEVWVKGPGLFKGYFNLLPDADPKLTNVLNAEGFYQTGDYAHQDDKGNLYVKGRGTDVIIYGSHVMYPGWLETRILSHPDVQAVCVVPVPDPEMFHEICACVKPRDGHVITEEQLGEFCSSLFLTDCEDTPKPKCFMVLGNDFPETPSGKNDRKIIRKMAAERFGRYK